MTENQSDKTVDGQTGPAGPAKPDGTEVEPAKSGAEDLDTAGAETSGTPPTDAGTGGGAAGGSEGTTAPHTTGFSWNKASVLNRAIAKFIDLLFALLLAKLPGYVGFMAGLTYIGIADGLGGGRSLGKRIVGLRVVRSDGFTPADIRDSILRNGTIGVLYVIAFLPYVGWLVALVGIGFESLLMLGSPQGKRLGDEIASTLVADARGRIKLDGPEEPSTADTGGSDALGRA